MRDRRCSSTPSKRRDSETRRRLRPWPSHGRSLQATWAGRRRPAPPAPPTPWPRAVFWQRRAWRPPPPSGAPPPSRWCCRPCRSSTRLRSPSRRPTLARASTLPRGRARPRRRHERLFSTPSRASRLRRRPFSSFCRLFCLLLLSNRCHAFWACCLAALSCWLEAVRLHQANVKLLARAGEELCTIPYAKSPAVGPAVGKLQAGASVL